MEDRKQVIFNIEGLSFGVIFVAKTEESMTPIRELTARNNMDLEKAGSSSEDDDVWVLVKNPNEFPKGIEFMKELKEICNEENGWYPDHCRTDETLYLMFLNDDALVDEVEYATIEA